MMSRDTLVENHLLHVVHLYVFSMFSVENKAVGEYANYLSGAVSWTGHRASILKVTLARLVLTHVEQDFSSCVTFYILCNDMTAHLLSAYFTPLAQPSGKSVEEASNMSLLYMENCVCGAGGVVIISPKGKWASDFSTEQMARAAVENEVPYYGLERHEKCKEHLS